MKLLFRRCCLCFVCLQLDSPSLDVDHHPLQPREELGNLETSWANEKRVLGGSGISSTLRKNHKRDTVRDLWAIMKDKHESHYSHYRLNRLGEEESIHFVTARKRHSVGIGCHAWRWLWWLCQALLARSRYTNFAPVSSLSSREILQISAS